MQDKNLSCDFLYLKAYINPAQDSILLMLLNSNIAIINSYNYEKSEYFWHPFLSQVPLLAG